MSERVAHARHGASRLVATALRANSRIVLIDRLRTLGCDPGIEAVTMGLLEGYGLAMDATECFPGPLRFLNRVQGDQPRPVLSASMRVQSRPLLLSWW
jgi:hypothetical protein